MKLSLLLPLCIALLSAKLVQTDGRYGLRRRKSPSESSDDSKSSDDDPSCLKKPEDVVEKFYDLMVDATDPDILNDILGLFKVDAVVMHYGHDSVSGRENIRKAFAMSASMMGQAQYSYNVESVWKSKHLAAAFVTATIKVTPSPTGPARIIEIREFYLFEKVDGCIEIAALMSNE